MGADTAVEPVANMRWLPSFGARKKFTATVRPPAPGRFSTTTGRLSSSRRASAKMRANKSPEPPGGKPTNSLAVPSLEGICAVALRLLMHRPAAALRIWRRCKKPELPWVMESLSVVYKDCGCKVSTGGYKKCSSDLAQGQWGFALFRSFAGFDNVLYRLL